MQLQKLPIGIQNFRTIMTEDYLYVDKTRQVHELVTRGKLYFLSRPRRFGKSLLISTLQHLFQGEKELFADLYIGKETGYEFKKSPVLYFSFAYFGYQSKNLSQQLSNALNEYAQKFALSLRGKNLSEKFKFLVQDISQKEGSVVILIDEYDKPIIDFLTEFEKADTNRSILKEFFSPLKTLEVEGHLKFLFITGISKFSRVSIFSDLNNLKDLTLSERAVDLVGLTGADLDKYFTNYINEAKKRLNYTKDELLEQIKFWYNGYSWDGKTFVFNPFSLLNFFDECRFANFWFATGTPTFLIKIIRHRQLQLKKLESKQVFESFFEKFTLKNIDIYALLFQTGYLTILSMETSYNRPLYTLGYPNNEVHEAFINNLIESYTFNETSTVHDVLINIEFAIRYNKPQQFIEQLKILFANIAYQLLPQQKSQPTPADIEENFAMWEGYFQTVIYLIISFLGLRIQCETSTSKGRIDAVVETDEYLYLMEFKLDQSAKTAIQQIKNRAYFQSFINTNKKIILLGIAFSKTTRNVKDWQAEEWQP